MKSQLEPLKKNTKPFKEWVVFGWMIAFKTASDIWAKDIGDTRETYYIKFCKLEMGEVVAYNMTLGKLTIYISKLIK